MDIKPENDFSVLCRVCMAKKINMIDIFSSETSQIVEKLEFCTGIHMKQEDGLPTKLCDTCFSYLSIAHKFKNACMLADKFFHNMVGQKVMRKRIKKEVNDSDFNNAVPKQELDSDHEAVNDAFQDDDDVEECKKQRKPKLKTPKLMPHPKTKPVLAKKRAKKTRKKVNFLHCDLCDVKFCNRQENLQHRRDVHGFEWMCEICGKQFMHRASHYSHVRSHLPPKHTCSHCDYKTSHRADLNKHILIHTGTKKYVCEYCTQYFRTTSNLYEHIRRHHGGSKTYTCKRCNLAFHSADKLRRHTDSHDNIKRYECEVCHSHFSRRCHWKRHLQNQHSIIVPQIRPGRHKTNLVIEERNKQP